MLSKRRIKCTFNLDIVFSYVNVCDCAACLRFTCVTWYPSATHPGARLASSSSRYGRSLRTGGRTWGSTLPRWTWQNNLVGLIDPLLADSYATNHSRLLSQQVCFQSLYILVVNTKLLVTWCWFVYNEFLILAEPQSDTAAVYLQLVTWHCLKDLYELEPVKARYVIIVVLVPQSLLAVLQCSLSSTKSNSFYLKSLTLSCILNTLLSSLSKDWVGDSLSLHFLLFTSKFLVIFWFLLLPVLCGWHVTSFKDRMSLLMTRLSSCSLSSLSAVEPVNCFHCCLDKMNLFLEFLGSFFASLIISSLFHLSVNQNKLKVTPTIVEVIFILQMHM